jgi:serine/threonine-protein kinase
MNTSFGPQPFDAGQILAGKFRVIRQLGFGGMGAVFEVEHELTRHRRALKVLHPQMADMPAVVERFLREASAAGRIGNAHIVETFDAGRLESGEPYIVMELLLGRTLAELLTETGPLDLQRTCELLTQACDGVAAAHAAGIVHRDLKPENLFLTGPRESFVKILDFGISKFDAALTGVEGLTLEGSPIGTPYYMSPEQVKGQMTVDARTDVYALGVVLYECLTAHRPFDGSSLPELIFQIAQGNYTPPTKLRPGLPSMADEVVGTAMAMDPERRFASAHDLARALSSLSVSPERTLVFTPAPYISSMPPAQSPRGGPVMTPGVFSRSSPPLMPLSNAPTRNYWKWSALGIAMALLLTAVWTWSHGRRAEPESVPSASALSADAKAFNSVPSSAAFNIVGEPLAPPGPSVHVASASTNQAAPPTSQPPHNNVGLQRSPSPAAATPENSARAKSTPSPSAQRSRVAAQGLAEDNPFK